jgi:hypothetical protein
MSWSISFARLLAIAIALLSVHQASAAADVSLWRGVLLYSKMDEVKSKFPEVAWVEKRYKRSEFYTQTSIMLYPKSSFTEAFSSGEDLWLLPTFYFLEYPGKEPILMSVELTATSQSRTRNNLDESLINSSSKRFGSPRKFSAVGLDGDGPIDAYLFDDAAGNRWLCVSLPRNQKKSPSAFIRKKGESPNDACGRL